MKRKIKRNEDEEVGEKIEVKKREKRILTVSPDSILLSFIQEVFIYGNCHLESFSYSIPPKSGIFIDDLDGPLYSVYDGDEFKGLIRAGSDLDAHQIAIDNASIFLLRENKNPFFETSFKEKNVEENKKGRKINTESLRVEELNSDVVEEKGITLKIRY